MPVFTWMLHLTAYPDSQLRDKDAILEFAAILALALEDWLGERG